MKNKFRIFSASFLVVSIFLFSGCGCKPTVQRYKVDLEVWGALDDSDAYSEIFKNYRELNPNIGEIIYKKQRIETYEKDLVDALASGKGPDVFLIHNTWLPAFSNKIVSAPKEVLTEQKFRKDFVDVCANDFISKGEIFAVPLSVNSLALYYNKDLFNAAGITAPPKTWDEFVFVTEKITKINTMGEIIPSGAAMGTAYNINRSTDILGVLMMQNGAKMRDANEKVNFGNDANAKKALEFYTDFSRNSAPNYSWNPQMHYSVDAFSEGTLAMMLNYSWQEEVIRGKSPKLNFSVSDLPQLNLGAPVNYANYWGYAVSSNKIIKADPKSKLAPVSNTLRVAEAWKFLTYLTTRAETQVTASTPATSAVKKPVGKFDPAENYLEKTKQPAARRDLIDKQKDDLDLGVFASSNLVAKSWKQNDSLAIESILGEMIGNVNRGAASVADALKTAEGRIQKLEMK
ncbi:MAG: extracellular solute-binding protein [Candidatus Moraniibacteriota bacterium]